jgi:hypothetical protein
MHDVLQPTAHKANGGGALMAQDISCASHTTGLAAIQAITMPTMATHGLHPSRHAVARRTMAPNRNHGQRGVSGACVR